MAYKGRVRPTIALTADDIAADAVGTSEIAAGAVDTAEIATDAVTANEIAAGAVAASEIAATFDISSKTVTLPAAAVTAHVTAFDDNELKNDIALLGFKIAAGDSAVKYSLANQVIDDFQDSSGVHSSSSNEVRETLSKYMSGKLVSGGVTLRYVNEYITSADYHDANAGGMVFVVEDMDGNKYEATAGGASANGSWNLANSKLTATGAMWYTGGTSNSEYVNIDYGQSRTGISVLYVGKYATNGDPRSFRLKYSTDNSSFTDFDLSSATFTHIGGTSFTFSSGTAAGAVSMSAISGGQLGYGKIELNNVTIAYNNMTLISESTTAESAPTKGDLIFAYTNGAGTATYSGGSPTIQAYISRDASAYTGAVTLTKIGSVGTQTILAAHDVDLSGIASGTAMRYKITTTGQSASMDTRINSVSLGWS